jgi:hypothetical protein
MTYVHDEYLHRVKNLNLTEARPHDLHGAQIRKCNYLRTDCAKGLIEKRFWHNRLQCKSYQRPG